MSTVIERPAWASRHEGTDEGPGWFERDLVDSRVRGATDFAAGGFDPEGERVYSTLVETPGLQATVQVFGTPSIGIEFESPDGLRAYAQFLSDSADEWERVVGGAR